MLSLGAEAVTVEPDGRGAPNASLHGRKWPCRAGVTGGRGRFRQETGLLMLFRDGPQGYSSLGGPLARLQSGECRLKPHIFQISHPRAVSVEDNGPSQWAQRPWTC